MPACALVARKNFVLHRSRPDERAGQVRNELAPRSYPAGTQRGVSLPPCGYCLKASMTVWCGCLTITLTLVLSHQGRGDMVGVVLFTRVTLPPLWIDESPITLCQRVRL